MYKPNFFCDTDVMNFLANMEYDIKHKSVDICVDYIKAPFWFIISSDDRCWTMKTIEKNINYTYYEDINFDLGTATLDKETQTGGGQTSNQMLAQNINTFLFACINLSCYIQENNLIEKFNHLDPKTSGAIVEKDGDQLSFKIVSGSQRPMTMCCDFCGNGTMTKPSDSETLMNNILS